MLRKFMGLFISLTVAFCFASCKDDEEKSDSAYCKDLCNKMYDECSSEYADAAGIDESDVDDLLDDCLDACEPDDSNEEYYDCMDEAYDEYNYPSECISYDVDYSALYDCELAAECDDLIEFAAGTGDVCEDEYDDAQDTYDDAAEECEDALEDMDEDDLADFNDASTECYDENWED